MKGTRQRAIGGAHHAAPSSLPPYASRLIRSARIGHLATADRSGQPHVVPICFASDADYFYSPIDEKPKRTAPAKLKRLRNIAENPQVSLIIDRYDEDWSKLAYVLITGKARVMMRGQRHRRAIELLRKKYPQYRCMAIEMRPMIALVAKRITVWLAH
ncbi:MAG TPA: TIGR03668 family PPOX class F420-dependent oxidoreductase [Candidatus Binatia bacterium]